MRKLQFALVMVFLVILLMSPQNPDPSYDGPTIGIQSVDAADGDNWLAGWQYRKQIEFIESGSAGTNYQIKIVVDDNSDDSYEIFTDGDAQADFDDIRFTPAIGDGLLDYWREDYSSGDEGIFWVEVSDSLSSGQVTVIYIYWGNTGASYAGSGANTFLFYEDWTDEDETQWTKWSDDTGGGISWSATDANHGTVAKVEGGAGNNNDEWRTTVETTLPFSLMFRSNLEDPAATYQGWRIGSGSATEYPFAYVRAYANTYDRFEAYDGTGSGEFQAMGTSHWGAWQTWEITRPRDGSNTVLYLNGVLDEQATMTSETLETSYASFGVTDSEKDIYIDWFVARKFIAAEPTISWPLTDANAVETAPEPSVDAVLIYDYDLTDNIFASRTYTLGVNVSHVSGYAAIANVTVDFTDTGSTDSRCGLRYTEGTNIFDVYYHYGEVSIVAGSDTNYTKSGDNIFLFFQFKISFAYNGKSSKVVSAIGRPIVPRGFSTG